MKKKRYAWVLALLPIFFFAIFTATALSSAKAEDAIARSFSIAHITDPHVFDPSYVNKSSEVFKRAENSMNLYSRSADSFLAALETVKEKNADYLIVSGDLTADGGRSSHEFVADALRDAQTEIRKTKPGFQIFVIPGNHDLYNSGARCYFPSESELAFKTEEEKAALIASYGSRMALPVNLADFYEIYHGLGYGSDTLGNLNYFYTSAQFYGCGNADYNRALAPNDPTTDEIESHKTDETAFDKATRAGGLSYVAQMADGFTLVALDSTRLTYVSPSIYNPLGDDAYRFGRWTYGSSGDISHEQLRWVKSVLDAIGKPTALVGTAHHAILPHSETEASVSANLVVGDFRTARYFLADLGLRYFFTGHSHANDVATYVSQKGNPLYDIASPSTALYGAAVRVVRLDVLSNGAEKLFDGLYEIDSLSGITDLIAHLDERVSSLSTLIPDWYLNDELVISLKDKAATLSGKTIASTFSVGTFTTDLLKTLIDDAFSLDLVKPKIENGKYSFGDAPTQGYHALDLAKDLVSYLFATDVSLGKITGGYSLAALAKDLYRLHLAGAEYASLTPELLLVSDALESGELPKKLFSIALDFLAPQIRVLFDAPISLSSPLAEGKGFDLSSFAARLEETNAKEVGKVAFNLLKNQSVTSVRTLVLALKKLSQNALLQAILSEVDSPLLQTVLSLAAEIKPNADILSFLRENILDPYLTDATYLDLGDLASGVLRSFATDLSPDGASAVKDGETLRYSYPKGSLLTLKLANGEPAYGGAYTFRGALGEEENPPTAEDGRLPEMISVTYGDNPLTQVNVKWFTRVQTELDAFEASESYIRYRGEKNSGALFLANGERIELTVPRVDLGKFYLSSAKVEYEMHTASLYIGGFEDGETISFEVGSDENGWSETCSFRKKAANGKTTVLAASDFLGSTDKSFQAIGDAAALALSLFPETDLILTAGNLVAKNDNADQWTRLFKRTAGLFSGRITLTAAGASEIDSLTSYLALPGNATVTRENGKTTGYYGSYDSGDAHFVILNTNDRAPSGALSAAETEWLRRDLETSNGKWKIVVMNQGIYSAGKANEKDAALRASLAEIFASGGVSLVLAGNDRTYSLSDWIESDGTAKTPTFDEAGNAVAPSGALYLSLGTLGNSFGTYVGESAPLQDRANQGHLAAAFAEFMTSDMKLELTAPTFAALEISANKLSILTYAIRDGETCLIDNVSIVKNPETLSSPSFSFRLEHDLKVETLSASKLKDARVVSFFAADESGKTHYYKGYSVGDNTSGKYVFIDGKPYLAASCFVATAEASTPSGEYAPLESAKFIALVPYKGKTAMRIWLLALILSLSGILFLSLSAFAAMLVIKKRKQPAKSAAPSETENVPAETEGQEQTEPTERDPAEEQEAKEIKNEIENQ